MCYYKIQLQNATLDKQNYTYDVDLVFNSASSVTITLNNGTSLKTAANQISMDISSRATLTYNVSQGQIVYLII